MPSDDKLMVTFSLTSSEDITRAYGNGAMVNDLRYAIYPYGDCDNPLIIKTVNDAFAGESISTTIQEELINGNSYTILFWADYDSDTYINNTRARYDIDWNTNIVTMYTDDLTAQDEKLDAFFAKVDFTADSGRVPVELKRPFSQLNIATNSYDDVVEVTQTALTIEAYTQFDLWTGDVVEQSKETLNFATAPIPSAADEVTIEVNGVMYKRLFMSYILVGEGEYTTNATFTVRGKQNGSAEQDLFTTTFRDLKLKRNSRTNVVGNIVNSGLSSN